MKMNGTNGVQLWDTAFAVKAFLESGLGAEAEFRPALAKALEFLDDVQVKHDVPKHDRYYRHISKGGFPFSTRDCGWIVADCTAEGFLAVMYLQELPYVRAIARAIARPAGPGPHTDPMHRRAHRWTAQASGNAGAERTSVRRGECAAVDAERRRRLRLVRAHTRLEAARAHQPRRSVLYVHATGDSHAPQHTQPYKMRPRRRPRPALLVVHTDDIMIEYSYTECTSAALQGLFHFHKRHLSHRADEIRFAMHEPTRRVGWKTGRP